MHGAAPHDAQEALRRVDDRHCVERDRVEHTAQVLEAHRVLDEKRVLQHDLADQPPRRRQQEVAQIEHADEAPRGVDDVHVLHVVALVALCVPLQVRDDVADV